MKQYCVDTSSFLTAWKQSPPEIFPDFWKTLECFLSEKRFVLPEATYKEILRQDDDLSKIIKKHKKCVYPFDSLIFEIQEEMVGKYNTQINAKGVNENDLAIIATAKHLDLNLVTEESWQLPRTIKKQDVPPSNFKIPRVCYEEKIHFCRLIHVFFDLSHK